MWFRCTFSIKITPPIHTLCIFMATNGAITSITSIELCYGVLLIGEVKRVVILLNEMDAKGMLQDDDTRAILECGILKETKVNG
ncbi:hypothetical protein FEM48_Zijuj08G0183400 [Ziziphus jujuba var. spinosa]|uniref:Pentatricopeptide repeat-containing protein n=1 Tax=Ziziphus jujuba var. spinosa TaxID=714518 RepID=A0A978V0M4_ZIZJJ|nr:hypothetical protein FEM48_Zijuj08G0183400 [Ziziphus jujuba var. spinosa]